MPVLANAGEADIDRMPRDQRAAPAVSATGLAHRLNLDKHRLDRQPSITRSRRYVRKLAPCVTGRPINSSRLNTVIRDQSRSVATSASRHLELAGARREDDICRSALGQRLPDSSASFGRGQRTE